MSDLPFTLDQLKILHAVSKEGSFKKAAEKLYISQPAVSLQIQNLENTPLEKGLDMSDEVFKYINEQNIKNEI